MLKVVKTFPSEEDANRGNYIRKSLKFAFSDENIFLCDNEDKAIKKFDLNGTWITRFGKPGQGPGEFSYPLFISYYDGNLYITDKGNNCIQIFAEDGRFIKSLILSGYAAFLSIANGKIMAFSLDFKELGNKNTDAFVMMNLEGEIIKKMKGFLSHSHASLVDYLNDNLATIRSDKKGFYVLQQNGPAFRTYDLEGKPIRDTRLERDPRGSREYESMRYSYSYSTFDYFEDRIFAFRLGRGEINLDVFDAQGKFLETWKCPMGGTERFLVSDMKLLRRNGKTAVYFLLIDPDYSIVLAEPESEKT
jgi:hypothetical protein